MVPNICSYDACDKPLYVKKSGFCSTHWSRWRKHGDPSIVLVHQPRNNGCTVDGCARKYHSKGFCEMHGDRFKVTGDPLVIGKRGGPRIDVPGYAALHKRINRDRGRAGASSCVDCGERAKEWSYDGGCPNELYETILKSPVAYTTDQTRYSPRCWTCHRQRDEPSKIRLRGADGRFVA